MCMKCCWVLTALKIIVTNIYLVSGTIPSTVCRSMSLFLIIILWGRNHYCLHFIDEKTEAQTPMWQKNCWLHTLNLCSMSACRTRPHVCFLCRFFWIWGRILIGYIPSIEDSALSPIWKTFFKKLKLFRERLLSCVCLGFQTTWFGERRGRSPTLFAGHTMVSVLSRTVSHRWNVADRHCG